MKNSVYPLTIPQQSLWYEHHIYPTSTRYNYFHIFKIVGSLNLSLLQKSWSYVINKHETLRTYFVQGQQGISGIVEGIYTAPIEVIDKFDTSPHQEEVVLSLIQTRVNRTFVLTKLPLYDAVVYRINSTTHYFLLNFHHLIIDGHSFDLILSDLSQVYNFYIGMHSCLPPATSLSLQEYTHQEQTILTEVYCQEAKVFWKKTLGKIEEDIQSRVTNHGELNLKGKKYFWEMDAQQLDQLNSLATTIECTLFELLASIFGLLLSYYGSSSKFMVGYAVSLHHERFQQLAGFLVNNLPLPFIIHENDTFIQYVQRIKQHRQEVRPYSHFPLTYIKQSLADGYNLDLKIAFSPTNFALNKLKLGTTQIETIHFPTCEVKNDLTLLYDFSISGLLCCLEYRESLYSTTFIHQFAENFLQVIQEVLADPYRKVSNLPVLTQVQYVQLAQAWGLGPEVPVLATPHVLFEQQAIKTPTHLALTYHGIGWSYAEVNSHANKLAHDLQSFYSAKFGQVIPADTIIGISMLRCPALIISILAVLKTGAAFTFLDPDYPTDRLDQVIEDAAITLIIMEKDSEIGFLRHSDKLLYTVEILTGNQEGEYEKNLNLPVELSNLAYVIYTSGTTGRPKGVLIEQRSLTNLIAAQITSFGIQPSSRVLQVASLNFDAAISEIFTTLCAGATLCLVDKEELLPGEILQATLNQLKISLVTLTPSVLIRLDFKQLPYLKTVISAGENCPQALMHLWSTNKNFINAYGPTECTVCVTVQPTPSQYNYPNIGKPLSNTHVYVLNKSCKPVPVGVIGELYVGGIGLARGYQGLPELTSQQFIKNPFFDYGRLYKTGDLVCWEADGTLTYIGRKDNQVKLLGNRIELDEVKYHVIQYLGLTNVEVILLHKTESLSQQMYVFIETSIPTSDFQTIKKGLFAYLSTKLPYYMIPADIVPLPEFPLTVAQKVDLVQLQMILQVRQNQNMEYTLSTLEDETVLYFRELWAQLFNLASSEINLESNFFRLGGDSILAMQMLSTAKQAGYLATIKQLFLHPTLAEFITHLQHKEICTSAAAYTDKTGTYYSLSPIQSWFFEQPFKNFNHWNQYIKVSINTVSDLACLQQAIRYVIQQHDAFYIRFKNTSSGYKQYSYLPKKEHLSDNCIFIQDTVSLSSPEAYTAYIHHRLAILQQSLDIENGPTCIIILLNSANKKELLCIAHHLIVDAVSWHIFLGDLAHVYKQLQQQQVPSLPVQPASYLAWISELTAYVTTPEVIADMEYWLKDRYTPLNELTEATCGNRTLKTLTHPISSTFSITFSAPSQLKELLNAIHEDAYLSIQSLVLAAFVQAYTSLTGASHVWIDLEGHGRDLGDQAANQLSKYTHAIGWFTALFPICFSFSTAIVDDFKKLARSIETQLRAVPHQGISYGLLRYLHSSVTIREQLAALPRPVICLNYLGIRRSYVAHELFHLPSDFLSFSSDNSNPLPHPLELNCYLTQEGFTMNYIYDEQRISTSLVNTLLERWKTNLEVGLESWLMSKNGISSSGFSKPFSHTDAYRLAPLQEGMLFYYLRQLDTCMDDTYLIQGILEIQGAVQVGVFQQAWQVLIKRHPILRTYFLTQATPYALQIIEEETLLDWEMYDWREVDQIQQSLENCLTLDRQKPFKLEEFPLQRFKLIQIAEDRFYFIWTFHHILLDGWCTKLILEEVSYIYQELASGHVTTLTHAFNYKDYVDWILRQDEKQAAIFWKLYLKELPNPTLLADFKTSLAIVDVAYTQSASSVVLSFPPLEIASIKDFVCSQEVTLAHLFQAAWGFVLAQYTQQEDIVFGLTISGRDAEVPGIHQMLGLFINTVPLRLKCRPHDTVANLLQQAYHNTPEINQYGYLSLSKIIAYAGLENRHLFNTLLVFENYPMVDAQAYVATGFQLNILEWREKTEYPLTITIQTNPELQVHFSYQATYFHVDFIEQIAKHLRVALQYFIQMPLSSLSSLPLLDNKAYQQVVKLWNQTSYTFPDVAPLHVLFERQAHKTPTAIALHFNKVQWSYQQINERSNQLAEHLIQEVGEDMSILAICLNRSMELVVSLLAVLKTGAAYLPVDPFYPHERIKLMLEETKPAAVLTTSDLVGQLTGLSIPIILLDQLKLDELSSNNLDLSVRMSDLVNIIYTSGSTGKPKGVCTLHQGLVNRLLWMQQQYTLNSDDRVLHKTSLSFDVAGWEWFWPLITGAQCVIAPPGIHREADTLATFIHTHDITVVHFVPSMLHSFLQAPQSKACQSLRLVFASGEALPLPVMKHFFSQLHAELHNLYGPTEASIDVTYWQCISKAQQVLVGRPIANMEVYILDPYLRPVPVGVTGELYIGGIGLAAGYLNQPTLTKERFIDHPFKQEEGAKLYRTGDMCRYLADGNIEYIGRLDNQIKLRGYRIELEEIEHALRQQAGVEEGVVVVKEVGDHRRLVAYVVGERIDEDTIACKLKEVLPSYMLPQVYEVVKELPLMVNGKVDRKALEQLVMEDRERRLVGSVPETEVEKLLADIWESLLGIERVSLEDNFFGLGGDSIVSIQVVARARQAGIMLSVRQIFETPILKDLAAQAEPLLAQVSTQQYPGSRHVPSHDLLDLLTPSQRASLTAEYGEIEYVHPLTPTQQGLLFHTLFVGTKTADDYCIQSAWLLEGKLDTSLFKQAWQHLVTSIPQLRSAFLWRYVKEPVQYSLTQVELPWQEENWSHLTSGQLAVELTSYLQANQKKPFNLAHAPLYRVTLIQLDTQKYYFIWEYHHILLDGWSVSLLFKKLHITYQSLKYGKLPVFLQEHKAYLAYIDYIQQQDKSLLISFWKNYLTPIKHPTYLGKTFSTNLKNNTSIGYGEVMYKVSETTTQKIRQFASDSGITVNICVQFAWGHVLHYYTQQEQIVMGVTFSGRSLPVAHIEDSLGLFIHTVPICFSINSNITIHTALMELQRVMMQLNEYTYVSLSEIQAWWPGYQGQPLFDTLYVFENYPEYTPDSTDNVEYRLSLEQIVEHNEYPLTLVVIPGEQLLFRFSYSLAHFTKEHVQLFANQLEWMLDKITDDRFQFMREVQGALKNL